MSYDALFAVNREGMNYERLRIETATRDIAIANTPIDPAQVGASGKAGSPAFAASLGLQAPGAQRLVRDPANPLADSHGMVHYPRVDLVQEMGTLVSASRGYEANLRAFNALRSMLLSAMSIGKEQS